MQLILCILGLLLLIAPLRSGRALTPFDTTTTLPLRGLLALCIVFHHVSQRYIANSYLPYWCSPFYHFLSMGAPVVATFFFLTGYGLCVSLSRKGTDYLKSFLPRRFSSFLPEFLLITIAFLCVQCLLGERTPIEQVHRFMLVFKAISPLPNTWFIYALIYVYIAFFLSATVARCRLKQTGLIFTGLICLYVGCACLAESDKVWYASIPSVAIGYIVAYYEVSPSKVSFATNRGLLMVIWLMPYLIVMFNAYSVVRFFGMNLLPIVIYLCIRHYGFPQWKFLKITGVLSLNIYLIHGCFLPYIPRSWSGFVVYPMLVSVVIIVAFLVKRVCDGFIISKRGAS